MDAGDTCATHSVTKLHNEVVVVFRTGRECVNINPKYGTNGRVFLPSLQKPVPKWDLATATTGINKPKPSPERVCVTERACSSSGRRNKWHAGQIKVKPGWVLGASRGKLLYFMEMGNVVD